MYKIGICILNYKSYLDVINLCENLLLQKLVNIKIIIADNGGENINEFDEYINTKRNIKLLILKKNLGYAIGNNFAIKKAIYEYNDLEYIAVLNPDTQIIDTSLFYNLISNIFLINDKVGFVSPRMLVDNIPINFYAWKELGFLYDIGNCLPILNKYIFKFKLYNWENGIHAVDCLPGSFLLAKTNVWHEINFFDERTFLFGEERIVCYKTREMGYKNFVNLDLSFYHEKSKSIKVYTQKKERLKYAFKGVHIFHKFYTKKNFIFLLILNIFHKIFYLIFILRNEFTKNRN